ncbi:MAG: cation-translocating P-type ATPase [Candidatus Hodarchaeota archaeon]
MESEKKMETMMESKTYFNKPVNEILKEFDVDSNTGLNTSEVERKTEKYGLNIIEKQKVNIWKVYFAPFLENSLIIVYLIAASIMLILSLVLVEIDPTEGVSTSVFITFAVVIINAVTAIVQQIRAQKSLKALRSLAVVTCTVIRDGVKVTIEASRVVPGDILFLEEGDRIPADARLISSNNFFTNESSITGESVPVNKNPSIIEKDDIPMQDILNCVFMGTFVTKGNARAMVYATGINTEIGQISKGLSEVTSQDIPLKGKINKFANFLGMLVGIMFLANWIYKLIHRSIFHNLIDYWLPDLIDSIDLGLKFIPINIVMLITIMFFTGVLAMAEKGVIVRNLTSIETLGRVSIVCTDKTGTLTENEMTVTNVYADGKVFEVTGSGYSSEGEVYLDGKIVSKEDNHALTRLAISGLMNNNAELAEETYKVGGGKKKSKMVRSVIGDPMEGALDVFAEKLKIHEVDLLQHLEFVKEYPFDSEIKRMTKVWASKSEKVKSEWVAFTKGATEIILDLSSKIMEGDNNVELTNEKRDEIIKQISDWAEKGYRTLGLSWKPLDKRENGKEYPREDVEQDMIFIGFVMIMDPPRKGVKEAVEACESAGVTVVMITGDHPKTAKAIGEQLSIYDPGEQVVQGKDLMEIDDIIFEETAIFARVSPDDKEVIVRRYQDKNRVVAMTGDGVNDALALGMSDVGLAMGITGTDVAKEAADMIISDDSFNTIETGIRAGRGLFAKMRVIIYFFVYANLGEAIILFAFSFVDPEFKLFDTGLQIQLIYVIAHALPPVALTFDRTSLEIMEEKPRDEEEIFSKNTFIMMVINMVFLVVGLLITAFLVYLSAKYAGNLSDPAPMARARGIALMVIFIIEISTVFSIRRPNIPVWKSFRKDMTPFLIPFAILSMLALIMIILLSSYPSVYNTFWLAPLTGTDWLIVLGLGLPALPVLELYKWYMRDVKKQKI